MKPDGNDLLTTIEKAIIARDDMVDEYHHSAFRLFNGFFEGFPEITIDCYGRSIVIENYATQPLSVKPIIEPIIEILISRYPWITTIIQKDRKSSSIIDKKGKFIYGKKTDKRIHENGIWYSIDLQMHQETSFYIDTRNLRKWAKEKLNNNSVLNTFAYTGSLGVAAKVGGASTVVHIDHNRKYLNVAKQSYTLNKIAVQRKDFIIGDFFPIISQFNRSGMLFDCVILDPPLFSTNNKGTVDLANHYTRLVNKVRPIVNDGGLIIAINNALFVSGEEYMNTLRDLCKDGFISIENIIPIPEDYTGYKHTIMRHNFINQQPFNHSTKIVALRIKRN